MKEMKIEERIHQLKFGGEEFNPNDFNDWAKENEHEAYLLCLQVAKSLLDQSKSSHPDVSGAVVEDESFEKGYKKGYNDATIEVRNEIEENYRPNI